MSEPKQRSALKFFSAAVFFAFVWSLQQLSVFASDAPQFSDWNFKPSAEEKVRYEYKHDFDFDDHKKDNGSIFYHRLRLGGLASLTDEYLKPKLDVFVEGLDAQDFGNPVKLKI